ncbi:MAG TPA: nuclear transport factor 2 family protein [Nitriliruptorales bacterium]
MTIDDEMTRLVTDMYAAFASGDKSAWGGRMAQDHEVVGIGSDPEEFWVGAAKLAEVTEAQVREMSAAGLAMAGGKLRVGSQGDVAWAVDEPAMTLPNGAAVPFRMTVIAVKEAGELRWTHFHLSAGVPNEEVLDLALPT